MDLPIPTQNIFSSHPLTSQVEIPTRPYKQQMLIVCNEGHSATTNTTVKLTCNKNSNLYTSCYDLIFAVLTFL